MRGYPINEIVIPYNYLWHFNIGDAINKESSLIYYKNGKGHAIDLAGCAENYHSLLSDSKPPLRQKRIVRTRAAASSYFFFCMNVSACVFYCLIKFGIFVIIELHSIYDRNIL